MRGRRGCERGRGSKQQPPITHSHAALFSRSNRIKSMMSSTNREHQCDVDVSHTHNVLVLVDCASGFDLVSRTRIVGRRAECDRTAIIGERVRHERKSSLSRITLLIRFFALHCAPPTPPPLSYSLCACPHTKNTGSRKSALLIVYVPLSNSCLKAQELRGVLILMFLSLFSFSSFV